MSKRKTQDAIYRIESARRRPAGTRRVLEFLTFVETPAGFERSEDILSRTKRAPIPYGPGPVPEKDLINFVGTGSGFSPEMPRLKLTLKVSEVDSDRPFEDIAHGYFRNGCWTVSERLKQTLFDLDPTVFEFFPIETNLKHGQAIHEGPVYWLRDLTRFLPAIDEPFATAGIKARDGALRFQRGVIGTAQIFRDESMPSEWEFCTASMRAALLAAGIRGLHFEVWGHQS